MITYRLSQERYSRDISGTGAELHGGRWNGKGTPLIYTGENRALCMAEIAVHTPLGVIPKDYVLVTITLLDTGVFRINGEHLPKGWDTFPYDPSTRKIGDHFVQENKRLALKVPSAIVPGEFNLLINPKHPNISKVEITKIESFKFDKRLFKN